MDEYSLKQEIKELLIDINRTKPNYADKTTYENRAINLLIEVNNLLKES